MRGKIWKLVLCVLVLILSTLSTALGFGFMAGAAISSFMKAVCGFIFIMTPLLVIQLIIILYNKKN